MSARVRPIVVGALSFIPGLYSFLYRVWNKGGGSSASLAYCVEVFDRHFTHLGDAGLTGQPDTLLELGPGDSLGVGLVALLRGAKRYVALDIERFSVSEFNHTILDQLEVKSKNKDRVNKIRTALQRIDQPDADWMLKYLAPYSRSDILEPNSVDLAISQAVFEHVNDVELLVSNLYKWLVPGGLMSHQIDFRSHATAAKWNGHWAVSDWLWRIIFGGRPYLINRMACSDYVRIMEDAGFEIVLVEPHVNHTGISRGELAQRFQSLTNEDLVTESALIIAKKPEQ